MLRFKEKHRQVWKDLAVLARQVGCLYRSFLVRKFVAERKG
jgi:hypothetical protein